MFFDSYAWIEWFRGSEKGRHVERLLGDASVAYTAPIVIAEVYSRVGRLLGEEDAEVAIKTILDRTALIVADEEIARAAGAIHMTMKQERPGFGMADAFVLASARDRGVQVVTGDPHFAGLPDVILLSDDKP